MAKNERLATLVEPTLQHMGYALVRVQLQGTGGRGQTLQIMAERIDQQPMTVDDCEAISRQLGAVLDVEDPISGNYQLEISSPGIDRPLTRAADFTRFQGHTALIELEAPHTLPDGKNRKRFQGLLQGLQQDRVQLQGEQGEQWQFDLTNIAKAKLVLTDELIKANITN